MASYCGNYRQKIAKIVLLNQDNVVTFLLSVKQDFSWTLKVHQREITQGSFFGSLPAILTANNIESTLQDLKEAKLLRKWWLSWTHWLQSGGIWVLSIKWIFRRWASMWFLFKTQKEITQSNSKFQVYPVYSFHSDSYSSLVRKCSRESIANCTAISENLVWSFHGDSCSSLVRKCSRELITNFTAKIILKNIKSSVTVIIQKSRWKYFVFWESPT